MSAFEDKMFQTGIGAAAKLADSSESTENAARFWIFQKLAREAFENNSAVLSLEICGQDVTYEGASVRVVFHVFAA